MRRRADPDDICPARRAAAPSILTTSARRLGTDQLVRQWEANPQAAGTPGLEATFRERAIE